MQGQGETEIAPSRLYTKVLSGYKYFTQVHLNDKKKKKKKIPAAELIFCGPTLKPHHWRSHPHSVCEFTSSALGSSLLPKAATSHLLGSPGQEKVNISSGFTSFSLPFVVRNLNTIKFLGQSSSENSAV